MRRVPSEVIHPTNYPPELVSSRFRFTLAARMARARSPLFVVFLTVFIDLVGFGIIIPVLPLYAEHFHVSPMPIALMGMAPRCLSSSSREFLLASPAETFQFLKPTLRMSPLPNTAPALWHDRRCPRPRVYFRSAHWRCHEPHFLQRAVLFCGRGHSSWIQRVAAL